MESSLEKTNTTGTEPKIVMIGGGVLSLCFAYNITNNVKALDGLDPSVL